MIANTYLLEAVSSAFNNTTDYIAVENRSGNAIGQVTVKYTSLQNPAPQLLIIAASIAPGNGAKKSFDHDGIQITTFSLTWQQDGFPESTETEQQPGSYLQHATVSVHNDFQAISDRWIRSRKHASR